MDPHDEGFARNLRKLGRGSDDYQDMAERPLASVVLSEDKTLITFNFQDGHVAKFRVEGDCCSNSWIEHLSAPDDLTGATISDVEDERVSQSDTEDGLLQVYQTKFRTPRGDIILEYRNESNGYYGGYLVRVRD